MKARRSRRSAVLKSVAKAAVVVLCVLGFLFQTLQFLFVYWTYPTVVDIQVSVPSEIDMPGISICSSSGLNPLILCKEFKGNVSCLRPRVLGHINACDLFKHACANGSISKDFLSPLYQGFFDKVDLDPSSLDRLRLPLEEYFTCSITNGAEERECNISAIIGSYYSEDGYPNFCYTIYSNWGNPKAPVEKIKKSEKIVMQFYIDCSYRDRNAPLDLVQPPRHNCITISAVQLAIHSRHLVVSPFVAGSGFVGGKKYKVKIKQDEKHLLPSPYQTNCTDYMPTWLARGGVGPLTQLMVIEECRFNASLQQLGCVPFFIDYPHNESVCRNCAEEEDCSNVTGIGSHCTELLRDYNQPCDFISYDMEVEEKHVSIDSVVKSIFMKTTEKISVQQKGYNCTAERKYTRRCQTIDIEVVFDEFEVTNVTYNPKFESLELFSVIGGYMGVYLGISIVAVYDFAEILVTRLCSSFMKRRRQKNKSGTKTKKEAWGLRPDEFQYPKSMRKVAVAVPRYPEGFRNRSIKSFRSRDIY